jgi:hypothetical protein
LSPRAARWSPIDARRPINDNVPFNDKDRLAAIFAQQPRKERGFSIIH